MAERMCRNGPMAGLLGPNRAGRMRRIQRLALVVVLQRSRWRRRCCYSRWCNRGGPAWSAPGTIQKSFPPVTDSVVLHRVQEKFFNSRVQASVGLASVPCSHSYLDISLLGPGQCTEPVCLELRKSGVFANKNIAPTGSACPTATYPCPPWSSLLSCLRTSRA